MAALNQEKLNLAAQELYDALLWYVDNDETNRGDEPMPEFNGKTWDEFNAYWIAGYDRAVAALAKAKGEVI